MMKGLSTASFAVLGIETSCDDTGVAVVTSNGEVLGNHLSSQKAAHLQWGGIVPKIAAREHEANIDLAVEDAMKQSKMDYKSLRAVAVTTGPGLVSSLAVGLRKAISISKEHDIPLISTNHLEGHALMVRMIGAESSRKFVEFPFLLLLVSGGHSQILLCRGVGNYLQIGGTLDDALGEAFDKVARCIGNVEDIQGGSFIEELAKKGDPNSIPFTIPMMGRKNCDLSFAGLKSAVARIVEAKKKIEGNVLTQQTMANIAASFQDTAFAQVSKKMAKAIEWCSFNVQQNLSCMVISGGVAKNQKLRKTMSEMARKYKLEVDFPPINLCTDNGVMIAWAGIENILSGSAKLLLGKELEGLDVRSRWPLSEPVELFEVDYPGSICFFPRLKSLKAFVKKKRLAAG